MNFVLHKRRILYVFLSMATIPAILFMFVVFKPAKAVSVVFAPVGDTSIRQWSATPSSTHYLNVDDAVIQPMVPDTSDYVHLLGTGRNGFESEAFMLGTPVSDSGIVSQFNVWMYVNDLQCKGGGSSNCDKLSVAILGAQSSTFGVFLFSDTVTPTVGSYSWVSLSFLASASSVITFDNMKNARVFMSRQVQGGGNSNNDEIRVAAIYLDVSYNPNFSNSGGVSASEETSTIVIAQKVGGGNDYSGGDRNRLEGEIDEPIPVTEGGATSFGGGVVTP